MPYFSLLHVTFEDTWDVRMLRNYTLTILWCVEYLWCSEWSHSHSSACSNGDTVLRKWLQGGQLSKRRVRCEVLVGHSAAEVPRKDESVE